MSLGEDRVRTKFNPSADSLVDQIKQSTAKLIDLCNEMLMNDQADHEHDRCVALAMTAYEEAAMWAVKAATAPKLEWTEKAAAKEYPADHPAPGDLGSVPL